MGEQCPTESVEGVDVFDGQGVIDWVAAANAGVRFVFIKATQGTYDTQSTFAFNWSEAKRAGVLRSAYHFFDPTEDGAAQAAHFLSVVGAADPGDLPPMLDLECPDGDPNCLYAAASGVASAPEITSRLGAFLRAIEAASRETPILYTFGSYLAENRVDTSGLAAYPLALAYPSDGACMIPPAPWAEATFWQYSWEGSVAGIAAPVDRDRFLGSPADLWLLAGGAPQAPFVAPQQAAEKQDAQKQDAQTSRLAGGSLAAYTLSAASRPRMSERAAGCSFAPFAPGSLLQVAAAANLLLVWWRRRAVARRGSRVLAGRTIAPCKRPTFAKA
jgi:lysozyme